LVEGFKDVNKDYLIIPLKGRPETALASVCGDIGYLSRQ